MDPQKRKYYRDYYARNRDKINTYNKARLMAKRLKRGLKRNMNPTEEYKREKKRQAAALYRERHPERVAAYVERNLDQIRERNRINALRKSRAAGAKPRNKPQTPQQKWAKEKEHMALRGIKRPQSEAAKRAKAKYAASHHEQKLQQARERYKITGPRKGPIPLKWKIQKAKRDAERFASNPEYYRAKARAQSAKWRAKDIDKANALAVIAQSKRRAIKANSDGQYTRAEIADLYLRQGKRCATCKTKISDQSRRPDTFHIDHVTPLSKQGSNGIENIQLLCESCNLRKKDKDPDRWAAENGLLFC